MYYPIQLTNMIPSVRNSIRRSPWRGGLLLTPFVLALAWLTFSPSARAVCNDGCNLSNGSTYQGDFALSADTTGSYNTAIGSGALEFNTTGSANTATGFQAL